MKTVFVALLMVAGLSAYADDWHYNNFELSKDLTIRAGYLSENASVPFRGNILFYEGLADSMRNHAPLFSKLTALGYRVIAFDYPGQGGSRGSMNDATISSITSLGEYVFERNHRQDCDTCELMNIIGWSTGGLAAYHAVYEDQGAFIKKVVLIAPGISPRMTVGEGLPFDRITVPTLTSADYSHGQPNPHVDPPRPSTPLKALEFVANLLWTGHESKSWKITNPDIKGLVLLADPKLDVYVKSKSTAKALRKNAPMFTIEKFAGARHELDNEKPEIADKVIGDIVNFFSSK